MKENRSMKNPVKSLCGGALFVAALCAVGVFTTGCEWESSGDEGSWNDSMGWVNFSGLYRSGSGGRALVSDFSLSSGGTGATDTTDGDEIEYPVAGQEGPLKPGPFVVIEDVINYQNRGAAGWSLKPSSVNITITGTSTGPVGSFTDDGSGTLSGNYSQVPGGPSFAAAGTINYDTGAWSLTLSGSDPFVQEARVTYTYVVLNDPDVTEGGGGGSTTEDPPTSGDWVYTLQITQTGNRLSFTDNRGFTWQGVISSVTTPGGDNAGRSPGDVVATFEVRGVTDASYKITGTFSGSYGLTEQDEVMYGVLTSRRIQGIWMEPKGHGDLYGEASDGQQTVVVETPTE
jgi:hypothetical protein